MQRVEIYVEFELKENSRYESVFDYVRVQLMDEPYIEFIDSEVTEHGKIHVQAVTVSAKRNGYRYRLFSDQPVVNLSIQYLFEKMHGKMTFVIEGVDVYMAQSWIVENFTHEFTCENSCFKNLNIRFDGTEVSG